MQMSKYILYAFAYNKFDKLRIPIVPFIIRQESDI